MEALRVEGLSKSFGGLKVIDEASLSLEVGEHVAVIGPNGAGKTTLFNLLTGELPHTSGKIYIHGRDITAMPTHSRIQFGLARSYQLTTLFPALTLLSNILLALQGTKPSRFQMFRHFTTYDDLLAKAQELLEPIDLWEKRDNLPQNLSHGEQRKVEIALALASGPKLLLLDEPSAGLAIAETHMLINTIKTLAKDITVFFSAHDMDVVFDMAERIIVLYFGQIMAQGTPQQIQADPRVREIYLGEEEDATSAGVN